MNENITHSKSISTLVHGSFKDREDQYNQGSTDLAFKVHDLRNSIGGALSFLDLLTIENEELASQEYIVAAIEGLNHAIEASKEISISIETDCQERPNNNKKGNENDDSLVATSVFTQLKEYMPKEYERLNKKHPIDITYSCTLGSEDKYFAINQSKISSLRENIISNAINAGATEIRAHYEMKEYCFIVIFTDNGSGMSEDEVNKLLLKQLGDGKVHGLGTRAILSAVLFFYKRAGHSS